MLRTLYSRCALTLVLGTLFAAPALAGPASYVVQPGDNLYTIARHAHVSVASLQSLNHLADANYLRIGDRLLLAAPLPVAHRTQTTRTARTRTAHTRTAHTRTAHTRALNRRIAAIVHSQRPRTHSSRPSAAEDARESIAAQAVWTVTHAGSLPSLALSPAYAAAQRTLAFEWRLTRTAMRFLGVPYVWGGTSLAGVDCSGFVQAVFHRNGIDLPRTADAQFEIGKPVAMRNLEPGDLVFFQTYAPGASHVGIYVGGGRFVHASSSEGVRVDSLGEDYYASRYLGARRAVI